MSGPRTMGAFAGERAVVVGFGASGQAATRALRAEADHHGALADERPGFGARHVEPPSLRKSA